VIIGRCRHLTRRSQNQQRAENSQNCLSHFFLRSSDARPRYCASLERLVWK
jgi:hypothetical protein